MKKVKPHMRNSDKISYKVTSVNAVRTINFTVFCFIALFLLSIAYIELKTNFCISHFKDLIQFLQILIEYEFSFCLYHCLTQEPFS